MKSDFNLFSEVWDKVEAALDGKPILESYLYRYPVEVAEKYQHRLKTTSYHDLPSAIATRWLQIFDKAKKTFIYDKSLEPIFTNIDNNGGTLFTLASDIFKQILTYGCVWALVDLPETPIPLGEMSKKDKEDLGIYPYVALYSQPNVVDWDYDDFNRLIRVVFKTRRTHIVDGTEYQVYSEYLVGYKQDFILNADNDKVYIGEPKTVLFNGVPVLPVVRTGITRYNYNPDYYKPPMATIVDLSIELYNRASANSVAYDKACFCFLAIGPKTDCDTLGFTSLVTIGPDDPMPEWIQPASDIFKELRDELNRLVNDIFTAAGVKNRAVSSDTAKSGIALMMEDSTSKNMVSLVANAVLKALRDITGYISLAEGYTGQTDVVFPTEYDTEDLITELEELERVKKLDNSALYYKFFSRLVVKKVDSLKDQNTILDEEKLKQLTDYSNLDYDGLMRAVDLGYVSETDAARFLNPKLFYLSDDEIKKYMEDNKLQVGTRQNVEDTV